MSSTTDSKQLPPPVVSLAFSNRLLPTHYELAFEISPLRPNYLGIALLDLEENERSNEDNSSPFEIVLNSVETVVTDCYLLTDSGINEKLKVVQERQTETIRVSSDKITFDELKKNHKKIQLRIHFLAVVRSCMKFQDVTRGVFKTKYKDAQTGVDRHLISTHAQPSFARLIFPCVDDLLAKASITLSLTTEKDFTCISNTPIASKKLTDDGKQLVIFEKTPKMTTSVFSFAIGDFEFAEAKIDLQSLKDFPVRVYTQIGESERANLALSTITQTLPILEAKLGVSYPIPKLDVVALPFLTDGGVENWSMIQILKDHLLTPDEDSPDRVLTITNMIKNVLVHEMVHMFVGNLITFESYDYTWLNEAFATFTANCILNGLSKDNEVWYDQTNNDMFNMKRYQALETMKPIHIQNVPADTTQSTFSKHSYEKGIFVLRMLASLFNDVPDENYDSFFKAVGDFVETKKYGLFRPLDLWSFLKTHKLNKFGYDIPTIMYSWVRLPGYPILNVSSDASGNLVIEQHRYLYNPEAKVEDVPYQVPLFIRKTDGSVSRQLLTDRRITINEGVSDVLLINASNTTIATVKYSFEFYQRIADNFDKLSAIEQSQVFLDLSSVFSESYQTNDDIVGFVHIVNSLSKNAKSTNATSLNTALTLLNTLTKAIISVSYYQDKALYSSINSWLSKIVSSLLAQFEWEGLDFRQLPASELTVRNSILSLDFSNQQSQSIAKKLYKNLMHGPKRSVPKKLLGAVLANVQYAANSKDYKDILAVAKNPVSVSDNLYEADGAPDLRTAAISSLGYAGKDDLRQKTLNFILSNMDMYSIESALLGLKFQPDSYPTIWSWFSMNFNAFYAKLLKDQQQKGNFVGCFKGVTQLVFESCLCSKDLKEQLERFLEAKKLDFLDSEYKRVQAAFQDRIKLNEADKQLKKVFDSAI